MATSGPRCRGSRYKPYNGAVARYNGYRVTNPFMWPRQERSERAWWGPSVFGPPWWAFLPNTPSFPCGVVALLRTTNASIGILRHIVGFLTRCSETAGQGAQQPDEPPPQAAGGAAKRCGVENHNHMDEVFAISRFWLSTEIGTNPSKQDITFLCNAASRSTDDIQTVVLGDGAEGTTIDAETGEVSLVARDDESGETVLVHAVRDLTHEIVLTQSLYEIDVRRQYFSDPSKYGHLLRELELLQPPPSRRIGRHLPATGDALEVLSVDAQQLLQLCVAYGFSEAETRRVLEHFHFVRARLEGAPPLEPASAPAGLSCQISAAEDMDTDGGDFLTRHEADLTRGEHVPVHWMDEEWDESGRRRLTFDADSGECC
ncbi:uncharacterized protein LOC119095716 [Pollicipes pollicipes]|uniref:uncharacterized protein LOC119095716 n=1 Tax=Pollicipes pollicipes TaxID=41117 RepID=UPI0018851324|nr:uncharacterized protein LOC119095716 [Pollicipes pollicipes]